MALDTLSIEMSVSAYLGSAETTAKVDSAFVRRNFFGMESNEQLTCSAVVKHSEG